MPINIGDIPTPSNVVDGKYTFESDEGEHTVRIPLRSGDVEVVSVRPDHTTRNGKYYWTELPKQFRQNNLLGGIGQFLRWQVPPQKNILY